jgi:hypothetical protein
MKDIEEMIADAKAEEEVKAEQAKTVKEQVGDSFRKSIEDALTGRTVNVDLEEYVFLRNEHEDLKRLINIILNSLDLGYSGDYLTIKNERQMINAIKVLYPEAYTKILEVKGLKAEDE